MPTIDANTVSACADCIAALGIAFAVYQLMLYKRELKDDHDRSRRENAIAFLMEWAKGLGRNASLTRKLVELLDDHQTKSLVDLQPFTISKEHRNLLIACLQPDVSLKELVETDDGIALAQTQVKIIKWQIVSYLNMLESILSAWRHNTADREMIEEQFQFLVAPEQGMTIVERYRNAVGGRHSLPAIAEFTQTILQRRLDEQSRQHEDEILQHKGKHALGVKSSRVHSQHRPMAR